MLVREVHHTLRRHRLVRQGDRVLVAVSGGPDSTALLYALHALEGRLGFTLEAATVDHQLRPEAALECALAMKHAAALGVSCTTLKVHVAAGASRQNMAREARFAALHAHAKARGCSAIAVGHTEDDQAETVLLRLLRGSGLRGLLGIQAMREDHVIRPLLHTSRAEVEAYLLHLGITEVARDPSNADPHYTRVRVRDEIMPLLRSEHPNIQQILARLADEAAECMNFVEQQARQTGLIEEAILPTEAMLSLHATLRGEVLRQWAERASGGPVNRAQRDALEACLTGKGEVLLLGGRVVHRTEQGLVCSPPRQERGGTLPSL